MYRKHRVRCGNIHVSYIFHACKPCMSHSPYFTFTYAGIKMFVIEYYIILEGKYYSYNTTKGTIFSNIKFVTLIYHNITAMTIRLLHLIYLDRNSMANEREMPGTCK